MKDIDLRTWEELLPHAIGDPEWEPTADDIATLLDAWGEDNPEFGEVLARWPDRFEELDWGEFEGSLSDIEGSTGGLSENAQRTNDAMDGIDIVTAYKRWIGKMEPRHGKNQRESVMISCPTPWHNDANPSAWMNLDSELWHCGGCGAGGDKWDMASYKAGIDIGSPGARNSDAFIDLTKWVAADLGVALVTDERGRTKVWLDAPPVDQDDEEVNEEVIVPPEEGDVLALVPPAGEAKIIDIGTGEDITPPPPPGGRWDGWKDMVPEGTFLRDYIEICEEELSLAPTEWFLMLGLMGLGLIVGNTVTLQSTAGGSDIKPNLFICLSGGTGIGKSSSMRMIQRALNFAAEYDYDDPTSRGVKQIGQPGSGEALVDEFQAFVEDDADGREYHPVIGLLEVDELSHLTSKMGQKGSTLMPVLQKLYDSSGSFQITSRGHGKTHAENPFMSFMTSTQPSALSKLLTQDQIGNGFTNRFIFIGGKTGQVAPPKVGGHTRDYARTWKKLQDIRKHYYQSARKRITYSAQGFEAYLDLWERKVKPAMERLAQAHDAQQAADMNDAAQARLGFNFEKLMLCMAINEELHEVTPDLVERCAPLLDMLAVNAEEMVTHMSTTDLDGLVDKIVASYERHAVKKGEITASLLSQRTRGKAFQVYPRKLRSEAARVAVDNGLLVAMENEGKRFCLPSNTNIERLANKWPDVVES